MKAVSVAVALGCVVAVVAYGIALRPQASNDTSNAVTTYQINRVVADFPSQEDFSTPEAAYATINRLSATGDQEFWRRITVRRRAEDMPVGQGKREVSEALRNEWLNAEILEVQVFRGTYACVVAKVSHPWKKIFDYRSFEFEEGHWRNAGNCVLGSLEAARKEFAGWCVWTEKASPAE